MNSKLRSWYKITIFSYLGLITTVVVWYFIISPPKHTLSVILSSIYLIVLLLPAPGLIRKSNRVYMWSSYIMLIYFAHGIIESWANAEERWYALLELVLSSLYFVGATMCYRYSRQPDK